MARHVTYSVMKLTLVISIALVGIFHHSYRDHAPDVVDQPVEYKQHLSTPFLFSRTAHRIFYQTICWNNINKLILMQLLRSTLMQEYHIKLYLSREFAFHSEMYLQKVFVSKPSAFYIIIVTCILTN